MTDLTKFEGHTPGPYVVIENPNKPGDYYVAQESGICLWDDTGSILKKADAALIAAAPKLLAEVKEADAENRVFREFIRNGVAMGYIPVPAFGDNAYYTIQAVKANRPLKLYHPKIAKELEGK